jgi:hypothetical protein
LQDFESQTLSKTFLEPSRFSLIAFLLQVLEAAKAKITNILSVGVDDLGLAHVSILRRQSFLIKSHVSNESGENVAPGRERQLKPLHCNGSECWEG